MRNQCHGPAANGLLLFIRLTPNASKDEVLEVENGIDGPVLKARVRAIPDKGKANKALIRLVAKWLGLRKSDISLKRGGKSRSKTLLLEGDGAELVALLTEKLGR